MKICGGCGRRAERWPVGAVLAEVLVSIILLGTFLGALCTGVQRGCEAAAGMRERAALLSGSVQDPWASEAWRWGPQIERVEWAPGPEASVEVGVGSGVRQSVGVWHDGWLLGEWEVEEGGGLLLDDLVWEGVTGREVVARTRCEGGGWGPPHRFVVPDSHGVVTGQYASATGIAPLDGSFGQAATVMHARTWGMPPFSASWMSSVGQEDGQEVVHVLDRSTDGLCVVQSDARTQMWWGGAERKLDVYW